MPWLGFARLCSRPRKGADVTEPGGQGATPLEALCDTFLMRLAVEEGLSPRTVEAYANDLRHLRRHLAERGIDRVERVTRHDVKARIEEFCALAGHEHVHKGMTSRDLTENVEQLQVRRSLESTV